MPAVQIASANFVLVADWNVGSGVSLFLMYMAFTISK